MKAKIFLILILGSFASISAQEIHSITTLSVNKKYWTPLKKYFAIFQGDGNLVVYRSGTTETPIWASNTHGNPGTRCEMQGDGNLVIYKGNIAIWAANSCCHPNTKAKLVIQDDGNLVILACINNYWIPLWSWMSGPWSQEQINGFPRTHPNGAKCSLSTPPPPPPPSDWSITDRSLCPGITIPNSWVIIKQEPCGGSCNDRAGQICYKRLIRDLNGRPAGSEESICPGSPIPNGWRVINQIPCGGLCGDRAGQICYRQVIRKY